MTTAKKLFDEALKSPMRDVGWTPRAAGWFTREVGPEHLAVLATSVATAHASPGEGQATGHLGLRVEQVEQTVSHLLARKDEGYKARTTTTPLGYVSTQHRWLEWAITGPSVERIAQEVAQLVATEGWAFVSALANDPDAMVNAVKAAPSFGQASGFARAVVLLAHLGRDDEAQQVIEDRRRQCEGRTDPAASDTRRACDVLFGWLADSER